MIERYSLSPMKDIWSEENKFRKWLEVEVAAAEAMAELGIIPAEAARQIKEKASFDVEKIKEREKITRHDVAAFVDVVAERVGEAGKYLHFGMTSYDVVDTALSLMIKQALEIVEEKSRQLTEALREKAVKYKMTPQIGRTHGVHAEPITFGFKLLVYYSEMRRNLERLQQAKKVISVGRLAGAVGTFSQLPPQVEEKTLKKLGLEPAPVSTQVLQRDRHAQVLGCLAILASTLEKIALEVRHLQRTEVLEVEEGFAKGQKGSSAMPHKRNPVRCERITGLARLVRGYLVAALENNALWHERDISHSSVERVAIPDAFLAVDFALSEMIDIIKNLVVHQERMKENIYLTKGLVFSQRVLLKLVEKGLSRDKAYRLVQRNAARVWEEGIDFLQALREDKEVSSLLKPKELEELFDLSYYMRHIDHIFRRVLQEEDI